MTVLLESFISTSAHSHPSLLHCFIAVIRTELQKFFFPGDYCDSEVTQFPSEGEKRSVFPRLVVFFAMITLQDLRSVCYHGNTTGWRPYCFTFYHQKSEPVSFKNEMTNLIPMSTSPGVIHRSLADYKVFSIYFQ